MGRPAKASPKLAQQCHSAQQVEGSSETAPATPELARVIFMLRYFDDCRLTRWFAETCLADYEMAMRAAYQEKQRRPHAHIELGRSPVATLRLVTAALGVLLLLALGGVVLALVSCSAATRVATDPLPFEPPEQQTADPWAFMIDLDGDEAGVESAAVPTAAATCERLGGVRAFVERTSSSSATAAPTSEPECDAAATASGRFGAGWLVEVCCGALLGLLLVAFVASVYLVDQFTFGREKGRWLELEDKMLTSQISLAEAIERAEGDPDAK